MLRGTSPPVASGRLPVAGLVVATALAVLARPGLAEGGAAGGALQTETAGEAGLELDSNVRRVESGRSQAPVTAAMGRVGARFALAARSDTSALTLGGAAQLRNAVTSDVSTENLTQLALDGQWVRALRDGELRLGPRLAYRDAIGTFGSAADRTFRSLSGDLTLVMLGGSSRVTVSAGPRLFVYKPNDNYSWRGGGATARGDFPLWRGGDSQERSLDLAAIVTIEQRAYRSIAFANVCTPGEKLTEMCFVATPRTRGDRVHRASLQLAYVGAVVGTAETQLTVVDSNSFGQSWVGARLRAALTGEVGRWYLTGTATVQLDRYLDGLLVARDREQGVFDALEDDSRSSLEVRLGRPVSDRWSFEARLASWRDLSNDLQYRRQVGYLGVAWSR